MLSASSVFTLYSRNGRSFRGSKTYSSFSTYRSEDFGLSFLWWLFHSCEAFGGLWQRSRLPLLLHSTLSSCLWHQSFGFSNYCMHMRWGTARTLWSLSQISAVSLFGSSLSSRRGSQDKLRVSYATISTPISILGLSSCIPITWNQNKFISARLSGRVVSQISMERSHSQFW